MGYFVGILLAVFCFGLFVLWRKHRNKKKAQKQESDSTSDIIE